MRRRVARWLLVAAGMALAACTSSHVKANEELTEQQSASYMNGGTATVEGQILVQPASGPIQYGSDSDVRIMPMTTEADNYVQTVVLAGDTTLPGSTFRTPSWFTRADQAGRFRFTEMAAGNYYVLCPMAWVDGGERHKAIAVGRAQVAAGATAQVQVSPSVTR
jgi:hypothetical protein